MQPDVSVVIPTYNRLAYLREAITSCFDGNDGIVVEVIVVDDGSSDGTRDWLRSLDDRRVRSIFQDRLGAQVARNRGLAEARAPFVKFLDDDDWLASSAVESQVHFLKREELLRDPVSVFGDIRVVSFRGEREVRYAPIAANGVQRVLDLLLGSPITFSPLHQRTAVMRVGGFDEQLDRAHDYDLHIRLGLHGVRFVHQPHVVGYYRDHREPRISNREKREEFVCRSIRRTLARRQLLENKLGKPLPPEIAAVVARQFWWIGRHACRAKLRREAMLCFQHARALHKHDFVWGGWKYRMLLAVLGAHRAELLLRFITR